MLTRRRRFALAAVLLLGIVLAASFVRPDLSATELKAKYAGFPSIFVNALGMDVHVRDTGRGPAIVLIHGLFDSLHTWEDWATGLDDDHRVIRFDLPGHGLTGPDPTDDYSLPRQVAFVEAVTSALGVESFVLVGNSLGGEIAWNFAAARPARVRKLVLVDAAGHPRKSVPRIIELARTPVLGGLMECCVLRSFIEKTIASSRAPGFVVTPALVDRYFELARYPGNRSAYRHRLQQRDLAPDLAPLKTITAPTLVLWGELDAWIPPSDAEAFRAAIPGAVVMKLPGVGHVPQEEDAKQSLGLVRAFLAIDL